MDFDGALDQWFESQIERYLQDQEEESEES